MSPNNSFNSGASNSRDFQPPTGNPQDTPAQVFQNQNQIQSGGSTKLLENPNLTIQVPVNPAPQPTTTSTQTGQNYLPFIILIVIASVVTVYIIKKYLLNATPAEASKIADEPKKTDKKQVVEPPKTNKRTKTKSSKKRNTKKSKKRK